MLSKPYFVQECPTCGRRLHIRVVYLGKGVVCQHCRAKFVALDTSNQREPSPELTDARQASALLRRVDELLQDAIRPQAPASYPR